MISVILFHIVSQSEPDFKVTKAEIFSCDKICIVFIYSQASIF